MGGNLSLVDDLTIGAIVVAVIGAIVAYVLTQHGPRLERRVRRSPGVRTTVEVDAPGHSAPFRIENDPAVFEADLPNWEGYGFVFAGREEAPPSPPGEICREWRNWARKHQAVDADTTKVQVIVEGAAERITIDSLEIDVLNRAEPLHGAHALCQVGGASASPREILVELDRNPPRVRYFAQGGSPTEPFLFTLGKDEAETFRIYAVVSECYCEWVARLHYVVDGKRMSVAIDDGGDSFRTTGSRDAQSYVWFNGSWSKQS